MAIKIVPKDRSYRLTRSAAPLSYILPSRNSQRFPLLYFDEAKNVNRALRYAMNQKSPFEDEQDDKAILQAIIFENGFLFVPKTNPILQQFLHYHPLNGKAFVEVDEEKNADAEVERIDLETNAVVAVQKMSVTELEAAARIILGKNPNNFTSSELKRDLRIAAKRNPALFLEGMNDPSMKLNNSVRVFFERKLLSFRNNQRDIFFNLPENKKKVITVPFGEDPYSALAGWFKTDEGLEALKTLELIVEEMDR